MKNSTLILIAGFVFAIGETAFFGWNLVPKTSAEILADGISLVIMAVGLMTQRLEAGGQK